MDTSTLINLEGGSDATFWKIVAEEGRGKTKFWPSIKDGREISPSRDGFSEYMKYRVERERETIRMIVAGNPISAETVIRKLLGCKCLAIGPTSLDIFPEEAL